MIGCGGITYWQDVVEFMLAGASAVQIGTAIAFRGLGIFKEIVEGIQTFIIEKGYQHAKEIIGLSHKL